MDTRSAGESPDDVRDATSTASTLLPDVLTLIERLVSEQLQPLEARLQTLEQEVARLTGHEEIRD